MLTLNVNRSEVVTFWREKHINDSTCAKMLTLSVNRSEVVTFWRENNISMIVQVLLYIGINSHTVVVIPHGLLIFYILDSEMIEKFDSMVVV